MGRSDVPGDNRHRPRTAGSAALLATLSVALLPNLAGCLMVVEDKGYQALVAEEKSGRQVYKLYPGITRPLSDLAIVLINDIPTTVIDGLTVAKTDYQEIHLLPGPHTLSWRKQFAFSVMVEPTMSKEAALTLAVDLQAGHTYKLFAERTYGTGYQLYFWIEDVANGKAIGGRKKP